MKIKSIIILVVLLVFMVPNTINATEEIQFTDKADSLKELGLFQGSAKGYELERQPLRIESAVMLIRLLGKEEEVIAGSYSHPFTDVPGWADKYIGYMYENNLTIGIGNNLFGSNQMTNTKSYATFVLRALGYDDSIGEFSWSTSVDTAVKVGVISEDESDRLESNLFLRDDMVNLSYNALTVNLNNKEVELISFLIEQGAVGEDIAKEENLVVSKKLSVDEEIDKMFDEAIVLSNEYTIFKIEGNDYMIFDTSLELDKMGAKSISVGNSLSSPIDDDYIKSELLRNKDNGGTYTPMTGGGAYSKYLGMCFRLDSSYNNIMVYGENDELIAYGKSVNITEKPSDLKTIILSKDLSVEEAFSINQVKIDVLLDDKIIFETDGYKAFDEFGNSISGLFYKFGDDVVTEVDEDGNEVESRMISITFSSMYIPSGTLSIKDNSGFDVKIVQN